MYEKWLKNVSCDWGGKDGKQQAAAWFHSHRVCVWAGETLHRLQTLLYRAKVNSSTALPGLLLLLVASPSRHGRFRTIRLQNERIPKVTEENRFPKYFFYIKLKYGHVNKRHKRTKCRVHTKSGGAARAPGTRLICWLCMEAQPLRRVHTKSGGAARLTYRRENE